MCSLIEDRMCSLQFLTLAYGIQMCPLIEDRMCSLQVLNISLHSHVQELLVNLSAVSPARALQVV